MIVDPGIGRTRESRYGDIFVAVGGNQSHPKFGRPAATMIHALAHLEAHWPVTVLRVSGWFETEPVPRSSQQWFVNGMVELDTKLSPGALLQVLHKLEKEFGRVRHGQDAPRVLDLDLIDFRGFVETTADGPVLPHPRCSFRRFVLYPLRDVAPCWRHPVSGRHIDALIAGLSADQYAYRLGMAV